MERAEAQKKISEIKDSNEHKIARLFYSLDFLLIDTNAKIKDKSGYEIGEIDLIFSLENYLFLIDVSVDSSPGSTKKSAFFNKWSADENINAVLEQYDLSPRKTIRIYFDLSSREPSSKLSPDLERLTQPNMNNIIGYLDDYEYFENSYNKIGVWARNDLLDWVGYSDERKSKEIPAIQYYINDVPVFCFVGRVDDLLRSCYISRKRKNEEGYQRTLKASRVTDISTRISKGKGLFFPNSILINMPLGNQGLLQKNQCPATVTLSFPTSFCTCRVIDGQHRLLGFSLLTEEKQRGHLLPVIALVDYDREKEIETFVDINSRQQRIDSNLILVLKSDISWNKGTKEQQQKIAVKVAEKLNRTFFKDRIYFGTADEPKGKKLTLTTIVSSLVSNRFVGESVQDTYDKISKILAVVQEHMPNHIREPDSYFGQNIGIRVLFRILNIFERNTKVKRITVTEQTFLHDLNMIMTEDTVERLKGYFGQGGMNAAVTDLVSELKVKYPERYNKLETNLRLLPRTSR